MRHLDTLLGAGDAVDADVLTRMRQAAPELGADPHATVAAARDTERRAVERVAQVTAQARSGNRGAELDLAGAETEARHAAADARRMEEAYNRALREASLAALSDIRPMGPGADTMAVGGPDGDSKEAVKRSLQFLPTDWLSAAEELTVHPDGLTRGYYNVDLGEAALGSEGASVASAPTLDAQALHQLGHHMQHSIPDLAAASEAYHWLRTSTGRIGNRKRNTQVRLADRFPTRGHRADATARDGYWADLLAGMDARDGKSWQLLPVGLESLFSDSWYLDDDLRKFLFGALAVLGRRP
ncbi:hypothetical protein [Actinacidiphila sp. bgisy160]|uniref:hypothetical protein n=1 Tax=Actinacidiphila sp. bgisy160 TaxID=3413796 RepID=UPI003D73B881